MSVFEVEQIHSWECSFEDKHDKGAAGVATTTCKDCKDQVLAKTHSAVCLPKANSNSLAIFDIQWVDFSWENLQETIDFPIKYGSFL